MFLHTNSSLKLEFGGENALLQMPYTYKSIWTCPGSATTSSQSLSDDMRCHYRVVGEG